MENDILSAVATKLDLKKQLKPLYAPPSHEVVTLEIPAMNYLMVNGRGDPNTAQAYQDAVEALYSVAYAVKFMLKKEVEYSVMPLEGLWWADGGREAPKETWQWTLMILQPDNVTGAWFARAREQVRQKKNPVALDKVRLESLHEGLVAQVMHIGPFANEGATLERIEQFMLAHGYTINGKHHEIYLNDLRRTAPEKLHTVLRQPIKLL